MRVLGLLLLAVVLPAAADWRDDVAANCTAQAAPLLARNAHTLRAVGSTESVQVGARAAYACSVLEAQARACVRTTERNRVCLGKPTYPDPANPGRLVWDDRDLPPRSVRTPCEVASATTEDPRRLPRTTYPWAGVDWLVAYDCVRAAGYH